MVLTETNNYHVNHIGSIRNNKEGLEAEFNVSITITRKRFGEYQEVEISGYSKDMREAKKTLQCIVDQAEIDLQEFRERKRRRNRSKYSNSNFKLKTVEKPKKEKKENMFELLNEVEDETKYHIEYPEISNVYNPNLSWGEQ
jgi:hypothetical protein